MGEIAQDCIGLYIQTNRSRAKTHGLLTLPPADPDLCVTVSCFNNLPLPVMYLATMQCTAALTNVYDYHNHIGKWAHGNPSCKLPEQLVPNNEISAVHALLVCMSGWSWRASSYTYQVNGMVVVSNSTKVELQRLVACRERVFFF